MGISSSSSKTTPVYASQITGASDTLGSVYRDQAPKIAEISDSITGLVPSMLDRYANGDPSLNAAQGYVNDTLSGQAGPVSGLDYFTNLRDGTGGNTSLDAMIAQTNNSVANATNAKLGTRGLTGGTVHSDILSRNLAQNETGLRYQDFNTQNARRDQAAQFSVQAQQQADQFEAQRKAQAAGMAPGLSAAQSGLLSPLFDAAGAVSMPLQAASGYASGIGGLLGQYQIGKKSEPWGQSVLGAASNVAGAFAMSDIRLKDDIRRVGMTDGGLPVYTYRYKGDPQVHMGVMAQEVAQMQPEALGPIINGYGSVRYGEVR